MEKVKQIASNFAFKGDLKGIVTNTQGNINATYVLTYDDAGKERKYLLQKINANVFKEPYLVMKNMEIVTGHIEKKLKAEKDRTHKTLHIIKTDSGANLFTYTNDDGEKEYYRAFDFIENCMSYDSLKDSDNPGMVAYQVGKSLGQFQRLLNDAPISHLSETIVDFHNTPKRFEALLDSIENQVTNRALRHPFAVVNLLSKIKECSLITEALGKTIPIRVTHNDTKLNNFMMDKNTGEGIALIDLDTVMPGSALFDLGDGIRSACSSAFEDETDLDKVYLDLDLTKAYLRGYLEEMVEYLTPDEINYMGLSIKVLTYELVIRFLTDYINGDTYFKIKYKEHNRDRFLNQYHLLEDVELKMDEINTFIMDTVKELRGKKRTLSK